MKKIHVIIDPQNDFIDDNTNNPSLAVSGALENMKNLANVLEKDKFDAVLVTLDTHSILDIAHTSWWRDSMGNEISPFTMITFQEIKDGKFKTADPAMQEYSEFYVKTLEENGNQKHFIWPNHCIKGSKGHQVHDIIKEKIAGKNCIFLEKGTNPKTEHYSAFKAEVPVEDDETTKLNVDIINFINSFDEIVFSGEALSHCVRASVLDFLNTVPQEDRNKVFILKDCAASVTGFENDGNNFLIKAQELGAHVVDSTQYLNKNKLKNKM